MFPGYNPGAPHWFKLDQQDPELVAAAVGGHAALATIVDVAPDVAAGAAERCARDQTARKTVLQTPALGHLSKGICRLTIVDKRTVGYLVEGTPSEVWQFGVHSGALALAFSLTESVALTQERILADHARAVGAASGDESITSPALASWAGQRRTKIEEAVTEAAGRLSPREAAASGHAFLTDVFELPEGPWWSDTVDVMKQGIAVPKPAGATEHKIAPILPVIPQFAGVVSESLSDRAPRSTSASAATVYGRGVRSGIAFAVHALETTAH